MLLVVIFTVFSQVLATIKIDSLPISANFKQLERGSTLVGHDRARIKALFSRHEKNQKRARVKGVGIQPIGIEYTSKVGFGSPPTYYNLTIDTGSPYTWIGAQKKYVKTETSIKQGNQKFVVEYTVGYATGDHYKDLVTLSSSLSIAGTPFGVASESNFNVKDIDGVLGLGPTALGKHVLRPNTDELVPTVVDVLFAQKKIHRKIFGLSLTPFTSQGVSSGRLSFGKADPGRYTGKLNWLGVTRKEPCNTRWGFEQTIKYGKRVIQPSSTGIADAGTSLIYITPQAFEAYSKSIRGSRFDESTQLLEIPKESVGELKSLFFVINGVSYEFTPNAQLLPRSLNVKVRGKANAYYSLIGSLTDDEVEVGVNFINGYVFSHRFYTAYDVSNSKIGFATTSSTYANVD
ncbi:unnamed protein product [Rhizoctonia solani]|uniref:Peptidase A1 domain-containing protein n=1 Tax=Rhizoctonia solani TaxID=456999 RepID=A0A8H3DZD6_9AGAM|nr:unnamed protein product [Rhizoctonia solani]